MVPSQQECGRADMTETMDGVGATKIFTVSFFLQVRTHAAFQLGLTSDCKGFPACLRRTRHSGSVPLCRNRNSVFLPSVLLRVKTECTVYHSLAPAARACQNKHGELSIAIIYFIVGGPLMRWSYQNRHSQVKDHEANRLKSKNFGLGPECMDFVLQASALGI